MIRAGSSRLVLSLAGLLTMVALWWVAIAAFTVPDGFGRAFGPVPALRSLVLLLQGPELPFHMLASLRRVLVGLCGALLIGVPAGLALGSLRRLEIAASPALQVLRMVSPLSWMPLAVMAFGLGDGSIDVLLTFAAVWPILFSTASGVRALDPRWRLLARSLAATRRETVLRIVLPGILGNVLVGVRLAIGILWIVLVPCEMLGVSSGLGYAILDARDRLAYGDLMALIVLVGLLGFLLDVTAQLAHRLSRGLSS